VWHDPVKRHLLNLLTALSLLLCVAVCVLWARSFATSDGLLGTSSDGTLRWAICRRGRIGVLSIGPWPYAVPARWKSEPVDEPQIGPWMALGNDWLAYGDEPVSDLLAVRHVIGVGQIENRFDGSTDYGRCTARRYLHAPPGQRYEIVEMPLAPAALLTALLPTVWCGLVIRRLLLEWRRRYTGRCARCGYDMRATPNRCPECGTIAPTVSIPPAD
jgi:hypothetical protein